MNKVYKTRDEILYNLKNSNYSLIVIGGGIIGATIALKASKAGISTLLLEKHDFSYGASSRTSKMLTGSYNDFKLNNIVATYKRVQERNKVANKASANYLDIVRPIYESESSKVFHHIFSSKVYDTFSLFSKRKSSKFLTRNSTINALGNINSNAIISGIEYSENLIDDSRYVIELLLRAKQYGADILNYAEVKVFEYNDKNINNVVFLDRVSGHIYNVCSDNIIIACGAWGKTLASTLPYGNFEDTVDYVKATNLIMNANISHVDKSLFLPKIKNRPNIFFNKWKNTIIIGPVVRKYNGDLDCIYAASDEIEYLIDIYNTYFTSIVNKNHITTTQSGLVPVNPNNIKVHSHPKYKLFMVEGGDFTLSDKTAIMALSKVYGNINFDDHDMVLSTNIDFDIDWVLTEDTINFLYEYYASYELLFRLNEYCKDDSSLLISIGLDSRIPRGLIKYFIEYENAIHLDDIMVRRLRFILTEDDCGTLIAEYIANEMATYLGWDAKREDWELKRYRTEIKRNRVSLY